MEVMGKFQQADGWGTLLSAQFLVLLHITFLLRFVKNQRNHTPFLPTLTARHQRAMGLFSPSGMVTPNRNVTPNRSILYLKCIALGWGIYIPGWRVYTTYIRSTLFKRALNYCIVGKSLLVWSAKEILLLLTIHMDLV